MKKRILGMATAALTMFSGVAADGVVELPKPALSNQVSLKQALEQRRTDRTFSSKPIAAQELSNLLWAANGANRANGKRTVPVARGIYAVSLYVALPDGVYFHNREKNTLERVTATDLRAASDGRKMGANAYAVVVMAARSDAFGDSSKGPAYIAMEAGAMMQNLYLYCAGAGLNTVVCGSFDPAVWQRELKLPENQYVILTQVVGYPK